MRPARLSPVPPELGVVLVAHGSRDPRAAVATSALARAVARAHPSWAVHASYLDHAGPRPVEVLASLPTRHAVVVPLLLTAAYHGRVDLPAVLSAASSLPVSVSLAPVLGPSAQAPLSPYLVEGLVQRLLGAPASVAPASVVPASVVPASVAPASVAPASVVPASVVPAPLAPAAFDAVVLAAAGTRDASARATVEDAADALSARLGVPCAVAYASAAPPTAGEAVERLRAAGARRIGMAAYFLAPGFLYDNAVRSAREAGAVTIAPPLEDAPEVVRLVAARVAVAARSRLAPAA